MDLLKVCCIQLADANHRLLFHLSLAFARKCRYCHVRETPFSLVENVAAQYRSSRSLSAILHGITP